MEDVWAGEAWRREAEAWLLEQLDGCGLAATGPVEQPRIRAWSTHLMVSTTGGRVWLKENCPEQRFEAGLIGCLAQHLPEHVAVPLAVDVQRGWLLTGDYGPTLREAGRTDPQTWASVLQVYAGVQRRLVPHAEALVAAGLPVLAPQDVHLVARDRLGQLARLPAEHPAHLAPDQVEVVRGTLDAMASAGERLAAGPVPLSFEHSDLHTNNVFWPEGGQPHFFDFGDAVLGHPFSSLLVALRSLEWEQPGADVASVRDAYLEVWSDLASRDELLELWTASSLVGCVNRSDAWRRALADAGTDALAEFGSAEGGWLAMVADYADGAR